MAGAWIGVAVALVLGAGCGSSVPTYPSTQPEVCKPKPYTSATPVFSVSAGSLTMYQLPDELMLAMPNEGDCGRANVSQLLASLGQCNPTCGDPLGLAAVNALDARLAQVQSFAVRLGQHTIGRAMGTDGTTFVAFPTGVDVAATISDISTPGTSAAPQPVRHCCPGCGPCTGGDCGSTVPTPPRIGSVIRLEQRCDCQAIYPLYCPDQHRPQQFGTCECADTCCNL